MRDFLLGPLALAAFAAAWLAVQRAWLRSFRESAPGSDALTGRLGCRGCGERTTNCERPPGELPPAGEEPS